MRAVVRCHRGAFRPGSGGDAVWRVMGQFERPQRVGSGHWRRLNNICANIIFALCRFAFMHHLRTAGRLQPQRSASGYLART